jgi:D-methionine transport system ATP-binding protein
MQNEQIVIKDLRKSFGSAKKRIEVLKGIDLTVYHGEVLGIIGVSGAGKSTLVRCLNRLENWDSGVIEIDGQDMGSLTDQALNRKRQKIGMIFQQFNLLSSKTVYENIALPLRYLRKPSGEIKHRVEELLEIVDLTEKRDVYPSQLSGGQKQRVAIARALANDPEILLSDEATSALDPQTTSSILQLLKKLNRELGLTIVVITHEMDVIRDICDRVAVIEEGEIKELGATDRIFADPQAEITQKFVASVLKSQLPEELLELPHLQEALHAGGVLARITVEDGWREQLLHRLTVEDGVSVDVIYGNVELVNGHSIGTLYALLQGNAQQLENALQRSQLTRIAPENEEKREEIAP